LGGHLLLQEEIKMNGARISRVTEKSVWLSSKLMQKLSLVARIKKSMSMKKYITSILEREVDEELAGIDEETLNLLLGNEVDDEDEVEVDQDEES